MTAATGMTAEVTARMAAAEALGLVAAAKEMPAARARGLKILAAVEALRRIPAPKQMKA